MRAVVVIALMVAVPARADVLRVGDRLAELDVAVDRTGKPVKLAAFRGHWVLVTIGASWCVPCKHELPVWDRIAGEFAGRLVTIALDIDDDIADGKAFHDRLKLAHVVRVYMPADRSAVAGRYGGDTMPTTFVADPAGIVRHVHAKFEAGDPGGEYRKLTGVLAKLLPPKPKPAPKPDPKPAPDPKPVPTPRTVAALPAFVIRVAGDGGLWSTRWSERLRF